MSHPAAALLAGKSAALFDAGFTLLAPTKPVLEAYLFEAAKVGAAVEPRAFAAAFGLAWPKAIHDYRSKHPDFRSSDELERAAWRDFTADLAAGFPDLAARQEAWHGRLVAWFDSPAAWAPMPHAAELLAELRGAGKKLAVASNWHSALPGLLAAHGLAERFDAIVTSSACGRKKPHAGLFGAALAALGVAADNAVHVGDSWDEDIVGAQAAGISVVWLAPDSASAAAASSTCTVRSLGELRSHNTNAAAVAAANADAAPNA